MKIITVSKDLRMYQKLIKDNKFNQGCDFILFDNNIENIGISKRYNSMLDNYDYENEDWFVFCHEDFEFQEKWQKKMCKLNKDNVYGVIGTRLKHNKKYYYGKILNSDKNGNNLVEIGISPSNTQIVDTVDCCCFIIHSTLIQKYNLRFDDNLSFHKYIEEFCIRLKEEYGIKTVIFPVKCQHYSWGISLPDDNFTQAETYVNNKFKNLKHCYTNTVSDTVLGSDVLIKKRILKNNNLLLNFIFHKKITKSGEATIKICKIPLPKIITNFLCKNKKNIKMKLGVSYNLFDGEELLEASIRSIRKSAYHINVIYQLVSNAGEKRSDNIENMLKTLKKCKLIDDFQIYDPDLTQKAYINEKNKRLLGFKIAKKAGCSHFLSMDVDEFYHGHEIESAKCFIIKNKIEVSAVSIIEYVQKPEYQLLSNYMFSPNNKDSYVFYVPFITKINVSAKARSSKYFPCLVDPTRKINGLGKFYLFAKHEIAMHHMSTIRKDLHKKFRNSTISLTAPKSIVDYFNDVKESILKFNFDKNTTLPEGYSFIGTYPVKKVENIFNIKLDEK